jgi:hypothetical protein
MQRLVVWVTDRLLRALGNRAMASEVARGDKELTASYAAKQTKEVHQLLTDIKRFADTIRDETPTEDD